MKLFELKDKNNKSTDLFKIENFTTKEEVIDILNRYYETTNYSILPLVESCFEKDNYNYVYVQSDGDCRFVESLTEFSEGFQSEEEWKVDNSVEIK